MSDGAPGAENEGDAESLDETEQSRITKLADLLAHHSNLYYNLATPEISDEEYDLLEAELRQLSPKHPQLLRVGSDPSPGSKKVNHLFPLRSLGKGTQEEDILHFVNVTSGGATRFVTQPKLDGSALSVEYKKGRLVRGATRGSGVRGEDVTANVRKIPNIPQRVDWAGDFHVRGEVVMPLDTFRQRYAEVAPNPRNLAAGALRQKYVELGKSRPKDLVFIAYDVKFPSKSDRHLDSFAPPVFNHDSEEMDWLAETTGMEVAEWKVIEENTPAETAQTLIEETRKWTSQRDEYHFEVDGVVIKADDLALRDKLGETSHHPRWALAWKFPSEQAETVLLSVEWQTGRTGVVTPVANVAPQVVSGVTVERCTLHNWEEVQRLSVKLGDRVTLARRGDVIPKVEKRLGEATEADLVGRKHANGEPFTGELPASEAIIPPKMCPSCRSELIVDGKFLRCLNLDCSARVVRAILYWCRSLEMDGIGVKLAEQLTDSGLVVSISDLYSLDEEKLSSLERMAEKSTRKILDEIATKKTLSLSEFLSAIGLQGIGPETARAVAQEVISLTHLLELVAIRDLDLREDGGPEIDEKNKPLKHNRAISKLMKVEGVGEKVARRVLDGLADKIVQITELQKAITITDEVCSQQPLVGLEGRTFCLTGSLSRPRKEIAELIRDANGKVVGSVSKNLDYLVAGKGAGGKHEKAESLGVAILSEAGLMQMLPKSKVAGDDEPVAPKAADPEEMEQASTAPKAADPEEMEPESPAQTEDDEQSTDGQKSIFDY